MKTCAGINFHYCVYYFKHLFINVIPYNQSLLSNSKVKLHVSIRQPVSFSPCVMIIISKYIFFAHLTELFLHQKFLSQNFPIYFLDNHTHFLCTVFVFGGFGNGIPHSIKKNLLCQAPAFVSITLLQTYEENCFC